MKFIMCVSVVVVMSLLWVRSNINRKPYNNEIRYMKGEYFKDKEYDSVEDMIIDCSECEDNYYDSVR